MAEFIAQYWLEVLFGLIVTAISFCAKHYYDLYKKAKDTTQNQIVTELKNELKNYTQEALIELRKSSTALVHAVLEVQGKQFKTDCKNLLETPNSITFEQFETLTMEYDIYKSLGGNGFGSTLFELVQEKYSSQMMQKDLTDNLAGQLNSNNQNNNNKPRG